MAYADLLTIQTLNTGDVLTAACMTQARDNEEFLIDPPAVSVFASASQTVTSATFEFLTADSENFDNDSMHSTATLTSRITIQTPGRYLFFSCVRLEQPVVTGNLTVRFMVNNTTSYVIGLHEVTSSAGHETIVSGSRTIGPLVAGDYVSVESRHSAAGDAEHTLDEFAATFITR